MTPPKSTQGCVALVGAGTGDPQLLTRAGAEWLSEADVVVYDRLAARALLDLAPKAAERIDVGKSPGAHAGGQERINELLVEHARAGKTVVRLKGGDPFVFGRGGEEASALAAAGVEFVVVPGVTAGQAAAAYAGIPLTDRRCAATATLVTGHEDPTREGPAIDYGALARLDTLVFYMGVGRLGAIAQALTAAGKPSSTPACAIERGATARQRIVRGTLATLPALAAEAGVRPPALIVVGEVVGFHDTLDWRARLPLAGRTVLVTRTRRQASQLSRRLRRLGAEVIEAPTLRIEPVAEPEPVREVLRRLGEYDWLVLTSPNGVEAMAQLADETGLDARALAGVKLAAIGAATAEALAGRFLRADLVPPAYTSQALARALIDSGVGPGSRVALPRADIATSELPDALRAAGAEVADVPAYRTSKPDALPPAAVEALAERRVDWITFTSSSTVTHFFDLAGEADLSSVRMASIGPVTSRTIRERGFRPTAEAVEHTIEGLVDAIVAGPTRPAR